MLLLKARFPAPLFLVAGAGARMPNELVGAVFICGTAAGLLLPWSLMGISTSWRSFVFTQGTLWDKTIVKNLLYRLVAHWQQRLDPAPPMLARALRAYLIASLGRWVLQADLDWLAEHLGVVEDAFCGGQATRDAGEEGHTFFDLPYHSLSQSAFLSSVQEKVLKLALGKPGPRARRDLSIAKANLVFGECLRMLSRSSAAPTCSPLRSSGVWWRRGRCPSARLWLLSFDMDSSPARLDYSVVQTSLQDCSPPSQDWHARCYPWVMAMTAEHVIRGTASQNSLLVDRLLECLRLATQAQLHQNTYAATTYRLLVHSNLFALARVLVYSDATSADKVRLVVPLVQALPSARRMARHTYSSFHEVVRRLACAVIVTELSRDLGAAVFEQSDILRGNKLAECLLACVHTTPCSKSTWYTRPHWAFKYEAVLALSGAVLLVPHVVCRHVLEELNIVWQHAESACAGGETHPDTLAFCDNDVAVGYMCASWAWKVAAYGQRTDERDYSRFPASLWSPTNPAWSALVHKGIERLLAAHPSRVPGFQGTRRKFLLAVIGRARARVTPLKVGEACFFETCAPEERGGGWNCCDGEPFDELL